MNPRPPMPFAGRLAIAGLICHLGPLVSLLLTLFGLLRVSMNLGTDGDLAAHARAITSTVALTLWFTIFGLYLRIVGIGLLAIAVIVLNYRARWLYGWLVGLSVWCLIGYPYFTIVGIFALVALVLGWKQFSEKTKDAHTAGAPGALPDRGR